MVNRIRWDVVTSPNFGYHAKVEDRVHFTARNRVGLFNRHPVACLKIDRKRIKVQCQGTDCRLQPQEVA